MTNIDQEVSRILSSVASPSPAELRRRRRAAKRWRDEEARAKHAAYKNEQGQRQLARRDEHNDAREETALERELWREPMYDDAKKVAPPSVGRLVMFFAANILLPAALAVAVVFGLASLLF